MSRYTKRTTGSSCSLSGATYGTSKFLEPGRETPPPKRLTFRDEGKIRELARKGEAWGTSEDRQLLDYAIAKGKGAVYLKLSPEQYSRLRHP